MRAYYDFCEYRRGQKTKELTHIVLDQSMAENLVDDGFAEEDPRRIAHPAFESQHLLPKMTTQVLN